MYIHLFSNDEKLLIYKVNLIYVKLISIQSLLLNNLIVYCPLYMVRDFCFHIVVMSRTKAQTKANVANLRIL